MSVWSDFWDWVFRRGGGDMNLAPKNTDKENKNKEEK